MIALVPRSFRDLASSDPSFEEARLIREAACKAHASVSIRDRFDEAVQARLRRPVEPFKPDDVIMVLRVPVPSKGGKWVGPGDVIQITARFGHLCADLSGNAHRFNVS